MDHRKVKSVAVTIRPRDGISDCQIQAFNAWALKKSRYSYTVTEKELEERHLHSALFFDEPIRHDNVKSSIMNLFPSLSTAEKRVAVKVKLVYSHDWISYLEKGDSTVVIHSNLPEVHSLHAYFSPKSSTSKQKTNESSFYHKLERLWNEQVSPGTECNPRTCRDFLFDLMYNKRLIEPLRDDRTIVQVSRHLHRFINKYTQSCIEINSCYEKDE